MKERLQELIERYKCLTQYDDPSVSELIQDLQEIVDEFLDCKPAKFYQFRQNNSGGSFDFDKKNGISVIVIIEAPSAIVANAIAESKGIEFDSGCPCCGDRWRRAWDDDGDDVPSYSGRPVLTSPKPDYTSGQDKQMPEGYIHYLDGRVVSFWE